MKMGSLDLKEHDIRVSAASPGPSRTSGLQVA